MKRRSAIAAARVSAQGVLILINNITNNQRHLEFMKHILSLVPTLLVALVVTGPLQAASTYFIKIDGVDGESTNAEHVGEIEIQSFSWGMTNAGTSGGGGAGKANFQDIHLARRIDKASPLLMLACATGQPIPSAVLVCRKAGPDGKSEKFYTIMLSDVLVTSVSTGGSSGELPTETFSLNFARVEWTYVPPSTDGTVAEPVRAGFDLVLNEPIR